MTKLTTTQINQLNMYSVYVHRPSHPLFTFQDVLENENIATILQTVQSISQSPNQTVAASYLLRRFGLFISMQFYHLTMYDEVWKGATEQLIFGENHEYDLKTVSTFTSENDWIDINDEREATIHYILHEQCDAMIQQVRRVSNISSLTLWENIFGYLLWHYHVLLEDLTTAPNAQKDLDILKSDEIWQGISTTSLFSTYLKGSTPSALLNTKVRTTCCLSKDVPGHLQCGFCPLK